MGKNDGLDSFIVTDYVQVGRIAIDPWRALQYLTLQHPISGVILASIPIFVAGQSAENMRSSRI